MFSIIRLPLSAITLFIISAFMPSISRMQMNNVKPETETKHVLAGFKKDYNEIFCNWHLERKGISKELFTYVMKGYEFLSNQHLLNNHQYISIADFSKPSTEKRLYILDVATGEILFQTYVAHGLNSGKLFAQKFSNKNASLESSLGFYVTSNTYLGKNGYSLRLDGCEKGINDKALNRGIVLHGANYVSEYFINNHGFLGRSHGCPAVPATLNNEIIETIKNGTCFFIYAPSKKYLNQSAILKS